MKNLRAIDLNLLVVFEAIYRLGSLSKASRELNMSQPAISHALSKLRHIYSNQLFIRTHRSMVPTGIADSIWKDIEQSLKLIKTSFSHLTNGFTPASSTRVFTLALGNYGEAIILPDLLGALAQEAPSVRLKLAKGYAYENPSNLESGEVDLALDLLVSQTQGLESETIMQEQFVFIVNPSHPELQGHLSIDLIKKHGLIRVDLNTPDRSIFSEIIDPHHRLPAPVLSLHNPHVIPNIIAKNNYIGLLTRMLALKSQSCQNVRVYTLPEHELKVPVKLFWHKKFSDDKGIIWLKDLIKGLCYKQLEKGCLV